MRLSRKLLAIAALALPVLTAPAYAGANLQPTLADISLGTSVSTPRPRPLPMSASTGFTAAPVPNTDAAIPFVKSPRADAAQLGAGLVALPSTGYRGEGFVPGSTAEVEQQRKLKPTPSINLTVPLD